MPKKPRVSHPPLSELLATLPDAEQIQTIRISPGQGDYNVCATNPRLLAGGEPHPECWMSNRRDYGFVSPKREFIETPTIPDDFIPSLAKKWRVHERTIRHWQDVGRWIEQRKEVWASIGARAWERQAEQLAETQAQEIAIQLESMRQQRDNLLAMQEHGRVPEQTATGEVRERYLTPKDLKDVVTALDLINKNIRDLIGLKTAGKEDDRERGPVVEQMVWNMNIVNNYQDEIAALPQAGVRAIEPPMADGIIKAFDPGADDFIEAVTENTNAGDNTEHHEAI